MTRWSMLLMYFVVVAGQSDEDPFLPPSVTMTEPSLLVKSPLNSFNMVCRATGAPTPQVRWYKDGVQVEYTMMSRLSPKGTLSIIMMDQFTGTYQCKAENAFGVSMSNHTKVDMAFLDDFPAPPDVLKPKTVNEGDPLKLDCMYSDPFSYPTPAWKWILQNTIEGKHPIQNPVSFDGRLSVDERGTLYFQHVLRNDNPQNWYHMCEALNDVMNIKKIGSPHQIKITSRVPIPDQPPRLVHQNGIGGVIEVIEGQDINMYCIFQGYPKVEVQWKKLGNKPKPFFDFYNGKTRVMFENSKNTDQYEGEYECMGYQQGRTKTAKAKFTVRVLMKPKFIEGPTNINVTEGENVTFTCSADAEPKATIEWFVNGKPLAQLPFDARRTVQGNRYTFTGLRRGTRPQDSDLHVVTCMARNVRQDGSEVGRSYMDGYINVVQAMKFVTPPENYTISNTSVNVILECEVFTDPSQKPIIIWHHNHVPISLHNETFQLNQTFQLAPDNSLIIFTEEFYHIDNITGEYECIAETTAPEQRIIAKAWVDAEDGIGVIKGRPTIPSSAPESWVLWTVMSILAAVLFAVLLYAWGKTKRRATMTGETMPTPSAPTQLDNPEGAHNQYKYIKPDYRSTTNAAYSNDYGDGGLVVDVGRSWAGMPEEEHDENCGSELYENAGTRKVWSKV